MPRSGTRYVAARGAWWLAAFWLGATMISSDAVADTLPQRAYVASQEDGTLRAIEDKAEIPPPIKVSDTSHKVTDVATSPDGRHVYVANPGDNRVYVVDAFTRDAVPADEPDQQLKMP